MLTSVIYRKLKNAADNASFSLTKQQSTDLWARGQEFYFNGLAARWGTSLDNDTELASVVKRITLNPSSNVIPYSTITGFEMLGFIRPTYVVSGVTYTFPSKPIAENQKYSNLSSGTLRYPRHYLQDDGIVLQPSNTPDSVEIVYTRTPFAVDFTLLPSTDDDIAYSEINVQKIIDQCLRILGDSQREFDYANQEAQESIFNSKQPPL